MGKRNYNVIHSESLALVQLLFFLGTAVLAVGASNASADEVATSTDSVTPAVEATDAVEESTSAVADSTEKKVVNVTEEGNTTVTTSEVTNTSLEAAKQLQLTKGLRLRKNLLKLKKLSLKQLLQIIKHKQRKSIQSFQIIKRLKNNTSQIKLTMIKQKQTTMPN